MSDFDKQEKRISEVFGGSEVPSTSNGTLATYLHYLKTNVELPCRITGIEDMGYFGWEEYYTLGPGSEKEHKRLRKTQASFMDTFELLDFNDDVYEEGIVVNVKRVSDKRKFVIPLADLEAKDEKSINYQLLNDYAVWFVNY
jgi:hypothetical protein